MKQCTNPSCNTNYLFSDRYRECPFCHMTLRSIQEEQESHFTGGQNRFTRMVTEAAAESPFLEQRGRKVICCGRVTELDADSVFQTKKQKLFQTFWYGEPYQMSQQSVHTVLCVEEIGAGMAGQVRDFTMYGSIAGKVHVGDEVQIHARQAGGQRVITSLYNQTTESPVYARLLIPAFLLRWAILSILLLVLAFVYMIYDFFHSGAAGALAEVLIGPVAICGIICYGIYSAVRSAFPGRRGRRRRGWF